MVHSLEKTVRLNNYCNLIKFIYVNKTLACLVNNVNLFVIGVDRDL